MDSLYVSMEGASWSDDDPYISRKGTGVFLLNIEPIENDNNQDENPVPIDILPDDLHERILSRLPLSATFKASCVCKKWNHIVHSNKFTLADATFLSKKTWYFMFTSSLEPLGYLYDPGLRKWYNLELPFMVQHTWNIAPSCGLVCFMDDEASKEMYICNPITREFEILNNPPTPRFLVYSALAFSVNQSEYTISVIRSMQASEDFLFWEVFIHVYKSKEKTWSSPVIKTMKGWRPGDISIICDNVLYILVFCTRPNEIVNFHGLISYDLDDTEASGELQEESVILAPCALTCGRLMKVQGEVVLVGGIGKANRPGVIKGIGVWVLKGREWVEVSRMPHKFVHGFGELDDVFASSGGGDLIYVQSYGGTALLVFDMDTRQWFWSQRSTMHKKFPLEIFSGFCFEPRLQFL